MIPKLMFRRYETKEIQDLGMVRPFTNSEKNYLSCKRQYTYEYIEDINIVGINHTFAYGSCWHLVLENILKKVKDTDVIPDIDDVHIWLDKNIQSIINEVFNEYDYNGIPNSEIENLQSSIITRIKMSIGGWLKNWKQNIHPKFKVLEVEMISYHQVSFNDEKLVLPTKLVEEVYLSDKEEYTKKYIYRLLKTGEQNYSVSPMFEDCIQQQLVEADMPYYKVGKMDAVLLHREYGSLWVLDHKSTSSPYSYSRKTEFDLQLISYCALLRKDINNGRFDYIKDKGNLFVGGVIWDLCSSDITEKRLPKLLKSGKISKAKTSMPPSWLLKKTIDEKGLDFSEYKEFYNECCNNDDKFFSLIEKQVTTSDLDRIDAEDFAVANQIHEVSETISSIDYNIRFDWDMKSYRHTICTNYSSCKFSNFCFANTKSNDILLLRKQKIFWISYS